MRGGSLSPLLGVHFHVFADLLRIGEFLIVRRPGLRAFGATVHLQSSVTATVQSSLV